jgi:hypothetical protein
MAKRGDHFTREKLWKDYRRVDAVLAVRTFSRRVERATRDFIHKPAAKLQNAWEARVPAILGRESAYRALRKSPLDYIEVGSRSSALEALSRLKNDPDLRRRMVENGNRRAKGFAMTATLERWKKVLTGDVVRQYERWCRMAWTEQRWAMRRALAVWNLGRVRRRIWRLQAGFIP